MDPSVQWRHPSSSPSRPSALRAIGLLDLDDVIIRGVDRLGSSEGPRDIVISGGEIVGVAPTGDGLEHQGPVFELHGALAFPGLTNSHDHLEFNLYRPLAHRRYVDYVDWGTDVQARDRPQISAIESVPRALRVRWGALKNLLCGVTTVAHHGSGERALDPLLIDLVAGTSIHSVRLGRRWRWSLNWPLNKGPFVFHVGEGVSEDCRREIDTLVKWNLFRRALVAVHGVAMTGAQAQGFAAIVWCPLSNELLFERTADISALKHHAPILFGTDSTLTADWNFWAHLRRARAIGALDDRELLAAVTTSAAAVWGRPRSGHILPGYAGDVVVTRKKVADPWEAFFAVDPEDLLLVVRAGRPLLVDASIPGATNLSPCHRIRIGRAEKLVAEDVPDLVRGIRERGVEPNLPIEVV